SIRYDRVLTALQSPHALDGDLLAAGAFDSRPHLREIVGQVDYLRLGSSVLDRRDAFREGSGGDQMGGRPGAREIEVDAAAPQPVRLGLDEAMLNVDPGAQRHQALDVVVHRARPAG